MHVVNDCLTVQAVHLGLLIQEKVPEIQVEGQIPPRVVNVLLIERVQNLQNVGLTVGVERWQVEFRSRSLD